MKVHFNIEPLTRTLSQNAPTLVFCVGLVVLCASIAHWSIPIAGVVAGLTLMLIGSLPACLEIVRGIRTQKD